MTEHRRYLPRWTTVAALAAIWWILWGTWSILSLIGGVLIALAVVSVFPLPSPGIRLRLHPWALLVLLARLGLDIAVATVDVAKVTLKPPTPLRNAVIKIALVSDSDVVQTTVAELVSLVPGTVVVEVDRNRRTLYLHVLAVRAESDLDQVRERVLGQEARIMRALTITPDQKRIARGVQ